MSLSISFPGFFRALWGFDPFPWQSEFATRLCAGNTPDFVAVPTGSGKTASLDAALFALADQASRPPAERTVGRRIFFIVNRRVIVDEAFERTQNHLIPALRDPEHYVASRQSKKPPEQQLSASEVAQAIATLKEVASALRRLTGEGNAAPLGCAQLRGGVYRDRSWASSLLQPMIICSTVDQAGSRLLFRGYGVSPQARPIHAALAAQDSLLIIDEAHISRPFIQTLEWVKRYRLHQPAGCETVQLPFQLIQMTATPPADTRDGHKITLTTKDHEHPVLKPRLRAAKPARLIAEPKAKGKAREEQMAKRLAEEAEKILAENHPRSIAIMVNRVATARSIAAKLEKEHKGRVTLLIGRLRPMDREATTKGIQERLKTGATPSAPESGPIIVVSTQCLEVGADLDFDALVTEAASLDALRQRFGRLNRGGRETAARAVIVLPGDQDLPIEELDEAVPCDPIYANAIPRTWRWLCSLAQEGVVDFGINVMTAAVEALRTTGGEEALAAMLSPTTDAPVLLPAYLDCWVQTNPSPAADPDVALFLHGPQREMADVQVCWRGDLPETANGDEWADILSLCPPTTAECLPVPLHVFRDWLGSRGKFEDSSGDVAEMQELPEKKQKEEERGIIAFVWRGPDDRFFAHRAADLGPGDTIVLRVQGGGWQALGHLPGAPDDPQANPDMLLTCEEVRCVDVAEPATASARRRAILRIHPALWTKPGAGTAAAALSDMALDSDKDWRIPEIKELLVRLLNDENPGWALTSDQREVIEHLAKRGVRLYVEPYPSDQGFVLTARDPLPHRSSDETNETGDTEADTLLEAVQPQELCDHTKDVLVRIEGALALLPLDAWREALIAAVAAHDWGKVDPRFQAMLRGTTPFAAMASEVFLAKSGSIPFSAAARHAARQRAELPEGFRHEMLSVQMAESPVGATVLPSHPVHHALALHLIATHHGYGRPFAPLVDDDAPPAVSLSLNGKTIAVSGTERIEHPAHALDSGLAERFWQMNRHYGWWGIAFLEAVLRLADQSASANPQAAAKP
jgi:CRISPR-associated endonuclease/helicase Cas3